MQCFSQFILKRGWWLKDQSIKNHIKQNRGQKRGWTTLYSPFAHVHVHMHTKHTDNHCLWKHTYLAFKMCQIWKRHSTIKIQELIMHLSTYCPTYPPTGKRWGFDLIWLINLPQIRGIQSMLYQIIGWKCTVLRGSFDHSIHSRGGEAIDFNWVKSPPLARGVVPGAIHW